MQHLLKIRRFEASCPEMICICVAVVEKKSLWCSTKEISEGTVSDESDYITKSFSHYLPASHLGSGKVFLGVISESSMITSLPH